MQKLEQDNSSVYEATPVSPIQNEVIETLPNIESAEVIYYMNQLLVPVEYGHPYTDPSESPMKEDHAFCYGDRNCTGIKGPTIDEPRNKLNIGMLLEQQRKAGVKNLPTIKHILAVARKDKLNLHDAIIEYHKDVIQMLKKVCPNAKRLISIMESKPAHEIARALGLETEKESWTVTAYADNNLASFVNFQAHLESLNLPEFTIARGKIINNISEAKIAFVEFKKAGINELCVKAPYGASGTAIKRKIFTEEDLVEALEEQYFYNHLQEQELDGITINNIIEEVNIQKAQNNKVDWVQLEPMFEEYIQNPKGLLLQEWITPPEGCRAESMSMKIIIDKNNPSKIIVKGPTKQILENETSHCGNRYTPELQSPVIAKYANEVLAPYLHAQEMYGENGIDFLAMMNEKGQIQSINIAQIAWMEFNPRATGADPIYNTNEKITGSAQPSNRSSEIVNIDISNLTSDIPDDGPLATAQIIKRLSHLLKDIGILYDYASVTGALIQGVLLKARKANIYIIDENEQKVQETEDYIRNQILSSLPLDTEYIKISTKVTEEKDVIIRDLDLKGLMHSTSIAVDSINQNTSHQMSV